MQRKTSTNYGGALKLISVKWDVQTAGSDITVVQWTIYNKCQSNFTCFPSQDTAVACRVFGGSLHPAPYLLCNGSATHNTWRWWWRSCCKFCPAIGEIVISTYSQKPADVMRDKPSSGNDVKWEDCRGQPQWPWHRLSYPLFSSVVTIVAYTNYYTVQPAEKYRLSAQVEPKARIMLHSWNHLRADKSYRF